jgi:GT2 family glycosyltransferase/glycosyltransferase involved in cell wall biosynthesis
MRLLVVAHGFPPLHQGGSEIYADSHARALRRLYGDDILILTRENDPARPEYDVRVERRDGLRIAWINNTFAKVSSFEATYRNATIERVAARVIEEFRPEAAHIHHLTCLSTTIIQSLAARDVPIVFTLHDYWLQCHRGQLFDINHRVCEGPARTGCAHCVPTLAAGGATLRAGARAVRTLEYHLPAGPARRLRQLALKLGKAVASADEAKSQVEQRCDHMRSVCEHVGQFLAPSQYLREQFVRFGIPADRIAIARYGFDHAPFANLVRTQSKMLRLGFIGSLMISKAPHVLLEAFAKLPPGRATLDLFGTYVPYHHDDGYRHRLEKLFAIDNARVHGVIAHDRIPQALATIDALVVPSIWPENSPLVIQEAFLAGVPVVAAEIGGIPELVDHGDNGLLFRPNDVNDLHRTLMRLLDEPTLLNALSTDPQSVRTIDNDVEAARELYELGRRHSAAKPRGRTSAVVLNHRTPQDTYLAVKSLLASNRLVDDLIVIDNDSAENCRDILQPVADRISYLFIGNNSGFSAGMNIGIRTALARGADIVLLMNSDVIVPPNCIERLEHALRTTPGAGIAGPALVARADPRRIGSLGIRYDPTTGRMYHQGFGENASERHLSGVRTVDAVAGCLMLVTRNALEAVGPLDEEFFFSFEDLDICLRARKAGFATILVEAATAYHEGGRSIGADSPRRFYFATRNHLLLADRTSSRTNRLQTLCRTSSILMLNLAYAIKSGGGSLPKRLQSVARGAGDYFKGRFGPD